MNTFDERKKGFEAKYIKDEEAQFKIRAKRNKCVGLWAASKIKPENIDNYVKEVRLSDLEEPGDEDIIKKLLNDFEKNSIKIERQEIIDNINNCETNAIKEFMKENENI